MTATNDAPRSRMTLPLAITAAALASAALVSLSACNTVSGAGQDLQEASDNVKGAINDDASRD